NNIGVFGSPGPINVRASLIALNTAGPNASGLDVSGTITSQGHNGLSGERDYIFCRRDGRPMNPNALRTQLYRAMDKAGIERTKGKFGFHILRHTAGSLIYAKSGDLKLVQKQLSHSHISTTSDIYVHLEDKAVEEGTDILTREILGELYPSCTQESEMVS